MSKPWIHCQMQAKKFGGTPDDYLEINEFMDLSKGAIPSHIHRALSHTSWFISTILPRVFGETFKRKSDGKIMSTRDIGESHVLEDNGMKFIPTAQDYLAEIPIRSWMMNAMSGFPPSYQGIINGRKSQSIKEEEKETMLD